MVEPRIGAPDSSADRTVTASLAASATLAVCIATGLVLDVSQVDDAFITFREADNFAAGHGLVYNSGDRVEAATSFLFAAVLGLLSTAGIDPRRAALALGALGLWLIAFLLVTAVAPSRGKAGRLAAPLGGLALLAASPGISYYLASGLETLFFAALLFGGAVLFLHGSRRAAARFSAGALFGLAACTRMEGAAAVLAAEGSILLFAAAGGRIRAAAALGLGFALTFAPVLALRWAYYGDPLPNTFYAKMYGGHLTLCLRGAAYVGSFYAAYAALLVALVAAAWRFATRPAVRERNGFLLLAVGGGSASAVAMGGDYFPFHRFLVPLLPLLALVLADGIAAALDAGDNERPAPVRRLAAPAALLLASLALPWLNPGHVASIAVEREQVEKRIAVGRLLRRSVPKDLTLLLGAAGAIPYYSRLRTYDYFGLTDPAVARLDLPIGGGIPGHEKTDLVRQVERLRPDLVLLGSFADLGATPKRLRRGVAHLRTIKRLSDTVLSDTLGEYELLALRGMGLTALCAAKRSVLPLLGGGFTRHPERLLAQWILAERGISSRIPFQAPFAPH